AARRLGREIALALARDGWDIGVHYAESATAAQQTATDIAASTGRRAVALQADLADEAQVLALLPRLRAALGEVGCVVNNASRFVFDDAASFSYQTLAEHMRPNLAAPVLLARELHRLLPDAAAGGVVVNLLDQKLYNPNPDFLAYSLSKAALAAATEMLAQALAPRLRVVGVAPGLTLPSYLQDDAQFERAARASSPLQQASSAADVAATVAFAARTGSITGSVILCDAGQHLQRAARDVSFSEPRDDAGAPAVQAGRH
ncbi:MAG TPA: SDR family oxidoreductase, partial [Burkholderiaceae bacterium]|nr:SDR family oxidoreductase [Burkholderiaceae bacterium]